MFHTCAIHSRRYEKDAKYIFMEGNRNFIIKKAMISSGMDRFSKISNPNFKFALSRQVTCYSRQSFCLHSHVPALWQDESLECTEFCLLSQVSPPHPSFTSLHHYPIHFLAIVCLCHLLPCKLGSILAPRVLHNAWSCNRSCEMLATVMLGSLCVTFLGMRMLDTEFSLQPLSCHFSISRSRVPEGPFFIFCIFFFFFWHRSCSQW